jgi:hypothetical protein
MTDPTNPIEPTAPDPELERALERARTAKPGGPGLNTGTLALAGLILAGGGFLGGYLLGQNGGGQEGPGGMVMRADGPMGGPDGGRPANLTIGTIESISGDTFKVKTDSGDTVDVQVVDGTTIRINKEGTITDLAEGDNVVVNGQRDGDTIEAEDVGSGMMMRREGGPKGAGG